MDEASSHRMQCMEIWGGMSAADQAISTPGLDVHVLAQPYEGDAQGGDIHYLSMCGAGKISRFLLADVAGHGQAVADMAQSLRKLLRKHINTANSTKIARSLNDGFSDVSTDGRFATALISTYFAPTKQLILVNAGHPRPMWYSQAAGRWSLLDHEAEQLDAAGPSNLPLGIITGTGYEQFAVTLDRGDIVLQFTDSLTEAADPSVKMLGEQGLLELAQSLDVNPVHSLGSRLVDAVATFRGNAPADDDLTLITMHHNAADPPSMSIGDTIKVMGKMIGLIKV